METACNHDLDNDGSSVFDDKNVLDYYKTCVRCRKQTEDLLARNNIHAGSRQIEQYANLIIDTGNSDRMLLGNGDSPDAPLLLDEQSIELESTEGRQNDAFSHASSKRSVDKAAWRKLLIASGLCLIFMLTELVGGYLASSLAAMTDAAHLMTDFIGFMTSLFSIWISTRSPTKTMTFGFNRAEVLGALFSILVVWLLTLIFVYVAIMRLVHGDYSIEADTMIAVAAVGILINIVMGSVLHDFGGSHTHSHSAHSAHSAHVSENINLRAAVIHVLGDLIQSVGVLIAAVIIKYFPNAKIADPICTFLFSVVIMFTTKNVFRDTMKVLMEGCPDDINYDAVLSSLQGIRGVSHVHNLHIWSLTVGKKVVSAHLGVDSYCDRDSILNQAVMLVRNKFNVALVTLQVEKHQEVCKYSGFPLLED